jgi:hypothetical protein
MSPEQAVGVSATTASDWYAFGAMLYEALTGVLPFEGTAVQVLVAKQIEDPPPPESRSTQVPEELARLAMELLERDPVLRAGAERVDELLGFLETEPSAPAASTRRPAEGAPFVGRAGDLAELRAAFEDCQTHRAPVIFSLLGTSGFGKSRLLRRFLSDIEGASVLVLDGRCYEREAVPFKAFDPLIDSLADFLNELGLEERGRLLPADFPIASRLFPVLREIERVTLDEDSIELAQIRKRGFDVLRSLLSTLCERGPVVLAIDDVQWGDSDSARTGAARSSIDPASEVDSERMIVQFRRGRIASSR